MIGTRGDPYTKNLLSGGGQYHHCCHSNLTLALAGATGLPLLNGEANGMDRGFHHNGTDYWDF